MDLKYFLVISLSTFTFSCTGNLESDDSKAQIRGARTLDAETTNDDTFALAGLSKQDLEIYEKTEYEGMFYAVAGIREDIPLRDVLDIFRLLDDERSKLHGKVALQKIDPSEILGIQISVEEDDSIEEHQDYMNGVEPDIAIIDEEVNDDVVEYSNEDIQNNSDTLLLSNDVVTENNASAELRYTKAQVVGFITKYWKKDAEFLFQAHDKSPKDQSLSGEEIANWIKESRVIRYSAEVGIPAQQNDPNSSVSHEILHPYESDGQENEVDDAQIIEEALESATLALIESEVENVELPENVTEDNLTQSSGVDDSTKFAEVVLEKFSANNQDLKMEEAVEASRFLRVIAKNILLLDQETMTFGEDAGDPNSGFEEEDVQLDQDHFPWDVNEFFGVLLGNSEGETKEHLSFGLKSAANGIKGLIGAVNVNRPISMKDIHSIMIDFAHEKIIRVKNPLQIHYNSGFLYKEKEEALNLWNPFKKKKKKVAKDILPPVDSLPKVPQMPDSEAMSDFLELADERKEEIHAMIMDMLQRVRLDMSKTTVLHASKSYLKDKLEDTHRRLTPQKPLGPSKPKPAVMPKY